MNKEYNSFTFNSKVDWSCVPIAKIDSFHWEKEPIFRPASFAQLAGKKNGGLYVRLWSFEENPRTTYSKEGDPVYKDSCLEFFMTFDLPRLSDARYINFEMNKNAVLLSATGKGRDDRKPTHSLTDKRVSVSPFTKKENGKTAWGVTLHIPETLLSDVLERKIIIDENEFYGNFYKCGDDTKIPHFGAFSPVDSEELGFHNPPRFAKINLKRLKI